MLSSEQRQILEHALGLNYPEKIRNGVTWRNYYCATNGDATIEDLVALGYMARGSELNRGRDRYYHCTDKALDLLGIKEVKQ